VRVARMPPMARVVTNTTSTAIKSGVLRILLASGLGSGIWFRLPPSPATGSAYIRVVSAGTRVKRGNSPLHSCGKASSGYRDAPGACAMSAARKPIHILDT
jgi:hypothetical protein